MAALILDYQRIRTVHSSILMIYLPASGSSRTTMGHRHLLLLRPQGAKLAPGQWAISINRLGREKNSIFWDIARAQRGLFRRFSQQGAQHGPPPPCYANRRSRGWHTSHQWRRQQQHYTSGCIPMTSDIWRWLQMPDTKPAVICLISLHYQYMRLFCQIPVHYNQSHPYTHIRINTLHTQHKRFDQSYIRCMNEIQSNAYNLISDRQPQRREVSHAFTVPYQSG